MAPRLKHAFIIQSFLDPSSVAMLGLRASGLDRTIAPITSGCIKFAESGVEAEILAPGADWLLNDAKTGMAYFDVRLRAKTNTGGEIYLQYTGRLKVDDAARNFLMLSPNAKTTAFGDADWTMVPTLETNDDRLKELEQVQLLGEGRWVISGSDRGAEYAVYVVEPEGKSKP